MYAAEVARKAADIIQQRGQCKNQYTDKEGRVCLWGAVMTVTGLNLVLDTPLDLESGIYDPIATALTAHGLGTYSGLGFPGAEFNDDPATTEKDVAKLLMQVADDLEFAA